MEPSLYVNRELSWLEFDQRVLEEALDPTVPLLERVKFLAIVSSNLDEFFMVRVAGLEAPDRRRSADRGSRRARAGRDARTPCRPARTSSPSSSTAAGSTSSSPRSRARASPSFGPRTRRAEQRAHLEQFVRRTLLPVLTPLAIDPGHPFPYLANRSLCLVAQIRADGAVRSCRGRGSSSSTCPSQVLPRFVPLPERAQERRASCGSKTWRACTCRGSITGTRSTRATPSA